MAKKDSLSEVGQSPTHCEDCSLFSLCIAQELTDSDRDGLDEVVRRDQPVGRNEHVFRGGDRSRTVTVLRSGSVKAYRISAEGDEVISGFYLPGEIVGLDALFSDRHPSFATALEDGYTCDIPLKEFLRMLESSPKLNQVMLRMLSEEISEARELLLVVGRLDARTRVALFLLSLSQRLTRRNKAADQFRLTMDRRDIANYLGLTIETVSRTLSALQREAIIEVHGKLVHILDRDALHAMAMRNTGAAPSDSAEQASA